MKRVTFVLLDDSCRSQADLERGRPAEENLYDVERNTDHKNSSAVQRAANREVLKRGGVTLCQTRRFQTTSSYASRSKTVQKSQFVDRKRKRQERKTRVDVVSSIFAVDAQDDGQSKQDSKPVRCHVTSFGRAFQYSEQSISS